MLNESPLTEDLASRECLPCKDGTPPIKGAQMLSFTQALGNGWNIINEHHLEREFKFPNFVSALAFTNQIGDMAERIGHHPDFELGWGRVKLILFTHKINGLSEADFVFAAKINRLRPVGLVGQ